MSQSKISWNGKLAAVDEFKYLGIKFSKDDSEESEVALHREKIRGAMKTLVNGQI